MGKLVSVIIPAYNHEKYVQEAIRSIIDQTYKNIELIIIDDGSKDSTWEKIQQMKAECEDRFVRVDFSTKENEGTCETFNKLLKKVEGDFVYIIASDDFAKPMAIEKEITFLENNENYGLSVGNNGFIDGNSKICYWDKNKQTVYDKKSAEYVTFVDFLKVDNPYFNDNEFGKYSNIYIRNYIPNGYLIRKSCFKNIKFTKDAPLEDYYLMLQLSKYWKFKYIDEVLFLYRWHGENTIQNRTKIDDYTIKTMQYEEAVLKEIDCEKCLPCVKHVVENGAVYKHTGIPFVFEKYYCRKAFNRISFFRILGRVVFKKLKKNYFI